MVRLRLDISYDGGPFRGLARQPGLVTVQGLLEETLAELLGTTVRTTASGRTDRGVHARAQVLHGDVPAPLVPADLVRFARRLDRALPRAITVHAVRRVPATFDARFSAVARAYRFRLRDGVDPRVHGRGVRRDEDDVWGLSDVLDVPAMRRAAQALIGEHDFAAFCRRAPGRTTVRRIDVLTLRRLGPAPGRIDVRMRGRAFCHQQVRSIVGCLVEVGRGRRPEAWLGEVLEARDRSLAAPVAPPHGLTLEEVRFGPGIAASPLRASGPGVGRRAGRRADPGAG